MGKRLGVWMVWMVALCMAAAFSHTLRLPPITEGFVCGSITTIIFSHIFNPDPPA